MNTGPQQDATGIAAPSGAVGQFNVTGKTLLIPEMAPAASRLLAAAFQAFGVPATVMPTYTHLNLGKQHTSGKECFPCQVTLGDILGFLQSEQQRLGPAFDVRQYVYFMPEADGPCRFGMYTKLHRLVLDRFPAFRELPILYLSTADGYAASGLMPAAAAGRFRRLAYVSVIIGDVLDRILWRVRPYAREPAQADAWLERAVAQLAEAVSANGARLAYGALLHRLAALSADAATLIDPAAAPKPRIGIVGEIYLRSHPASNQQLIREIERFGGEVLNASMGEWVNFISFRQQRAAARDFATARRQGRPRAMTAAARRWLAGHLEFAWQRLRQAQVYRAVRPHVAIASDHAIAEIEHLVERNRNFCFEIGTEAALSIGGALAYAHAGFDGVVNVYPFTCMPSTIASAVLKPLLPELNIPYLDATYDGTQQPNREVALRTFMYQAAGRKASAQAQGTAPWPNT